MTTIVYSDFFTYINGGYLHTKFEVFSISIFESPEKAHLNRVKFSQSYIMMTHT